MTDLTKLSFLSSLNYMKRDQSSGTGSVTLPALGSSVTKTVSHGLGYIPFYEVYTEIDNAGIIWNNTKIDKFTGSSATGTRDNPLVFNWTTTSTLSIQLLNTPGATGNRTLYWLIYLDYGNIS